MPDPNDLQPHDIQVSEQPFFRINGSVATQTRVTYYVGTHGPFVLTYDPSEATTERIQTDINSKVQQLRILEGMQKPA